MSSIKRTALFSRYKKPIYVNIIRIIWWNTREEIRFDFYEIARQNWSWYWLDLWWAVVVTVIVRQTKKHPDWTDVVAGSFHFSYSAFYFTIK